MESPAASEAQPSNAQNDRQNDEALRCFMEVVICESLCSATAASMNICKISQTLAYILSCLEQKEYWWLLKPSQGIYKSPRVPEKETLEWIAL